MKATAREDIRTCSSCGETSTHNVAIVAGDVTVTVCERCAARLVRLLGRALKALSKEMI